MQASWHSEVTYTSRLPMQRRQGMYAVSSGFHEYLARMRNRDLAMHCGCTSLPTRRTKVEVPAICIPGREISLASHSVD
jgi:hypothetical protein